jgi:hypothetical protein
LKFYPDNPNPKAMTRIKEKMLIGKEKNIEKNMNGHNSIDLEEIK